MSNLPGKNVSDLLSFDENSTKPLHHHSREDFLSPKLLTALLLRLFRTRGPGMQAAPHVGVNRSRSSNCRLAKSWLFFFFVFAQECSGGIMDAESRAKAVWEKDYNDASRRRQQWHGHAYHLRTRFSNAEWLHQFRWIILSSARGAKVIADYRWKIIDREKSCLWIFIADSFLTSCTPGANNNHHK